MHTCRVNNGELSRKEYKGRTLGWSLNEEAEKKYRNLLVIGKDWKGDLEQNFS